MAILLTGGTGFVGSNVIDQVINNSSEWGYSKEDLYVLVREKSKTENLKKKDIQLRFGDLAKPETLKKAVQGIEKVLHLGAVVLDQSPPELLRKVNIVGTKELFKAFQKEQQAKKFVFCSTWGAYGYKVKDKPMTEDQPFDPTTDYHKSKVAAEKFLWEQMNQKTIPIAIARFPMIMGPGDTLTTPRVVQAFFDGKVKMIGNGKNLFSGIHVKDAARSLLALGKNGSANNQVYNVKSFDISQKAYWDAHAEAINLPKKYPTFPKWLAMFYAWTKEVSAKIKGAGKPSLTRHRVMRYGNTRVIDTSKITNDLQWKPKYTDGRSIIKETIQWLIDNDFINFETKKVKLVRRWEDHFIRNKKKD